jgi:hypothetical protein
LGKYKDRVTYRFRDSYTVVWGCETWSATLKEAHRLKVFENRLLRKICGPKRKEIAAEWRKLHNEKLHDLYS